jgi:hypothetical protein
MREDTKTSRDVVNANVRLEGDGFAMSFQVTVPAGPTTESELLPFAQTLSDAIVKKPPVSCKRLAKESLAQAAAVLAAEASLPSHRLRHKRVLAQDRFHFQWPGLKDLELRTLAQCLIPMLH